MTRQYICGIPVRIRYLDRVNQTLVHCDSFQRQLVEDKLKLQGNVIIPGRWSYVAVQGRLQQV